MSAAPAVQLSVERFFAWRCGLVCLLALSAAALAAWWLSGAPQRLDGNLSGGLTTLSVCAWAAAVTRLKTNAFQLQWDGQQWHVGLLVPPTADRWAGQVQVSLDFGNWMLLKFTPERKGRCPWRWLPLQRQGLEPTWHALRCAVFATPRKASAGVSP